MALFNSLLGGSPSQQPMASLLGQYYNPEEARKQAVSQAMLQAGIGLLSQGPTPYKQGFLSSLAPGLAGAAQGAQQGRENYMRSALDAYAINDEQQKAKKAEDEKTASQKRYDEWLNQSGLSPAQKLYLKANPQAADNIAGSIFPKPEDPLDRRYKEAQIKALEARPTAQGDSVTAQTEARQQAAAQMGLTPNDPAYKSYVLTGRMPREDQAPLTATDKKAILEADDAVMANRTVIDALKSVTAQGPDGKSLNDKAGYGMTADAQAWAARNDPTGFFDQSQGEATTELKNVVLGQALAGLKATFGAAPTEGERKILLELQASVDKTPRERQIIIDRAIKIAEARLQFNEQRAAEMRGQTFYQPGGGQSGGSGSGGGKTSQGVPWSVEP